MSPTGSLQNMITRPHVFENPMHMYADPSVNVFNLVTVAAHAVSALALLIIVLIKDDVVYELTHNVVSFVHSDAPLPQPPATQVHQFADMKIYSRVDKTGLHLSLGAMIILFFTLSAFFQLAYATSQPRYIEYAFSGSLVIIIILLQVGIYDAHTLFAMAGLSITMNLLGYVADLAFFGDNFLTRRDEASHTQDAPESQEPNILQNRLIPIEAVVRAQTEHLVQKQSKQKSKKIAFIAHFIGWIAFLPIVTSIIAAYLTINRASVNKPPQFVTFIVAFEVLMLTCFGLAQTASFTSYFINNKIYIHIVFITLSATAKLLLGWILAAELFL